MPKAFRLDAQNTATPPFLRPATVFFETTQDANHPQVKSFLSMMGCSDLRVIDPGAKHLLEITMQDVLNDSGKRIYNKQDFPHIYDYSKGRVCGNGRMTGRQKLLTCAFGGAYYCDKKCQKAKWSEHKLEHTDFLADKEAKDERKRER